MGTAVLKRLERGVNHSPTSVGEIKSKDVGTSSFRKCLHSLELENLSLPLPAVLLGSSSSSKIISNCDVISDKLILKVVE